MTDLSQYEILLEDDRVEIVRESLLAMMPSLYDTDLISFIVPARRVMKRTPEGLEYESWLPDKAVFAAVTPNPRAKGQALLTSATMDLDAWYEGEKDRSHFVGAPDELFKIYGLVVREQLPIIDNLRSMN